MGELSDMGIGELFGMEMGCMTRELGDMGEVSRQRMGALGVMGMGDESGG